MPPTRRSPVTQLRIAETVAADLRHRILADGGRGNFRMPTQEQLMEEFGVSHPSIREAIRILETEGLVTVRRGKVGGAEVHLPDGASAAYHFGLALQAGGVPISDLAECLATLEPMCAASCARREDRATAVVPILTESIDRSAELVGTGPEFTAAAREFHKLVVDLSANATMRYTVSALVSLWSVQEQSWARDVAERGEYPTEEESQTVVDVHRGVLAAIADGDAERAERKARSHLRATQEFVRGPLGDGVIDTTSAEVRRAFLTSRQL